jgi:pseudoazurin
MRTAIFCFGITAFLAAQSACAKTVEVAMKDSGSAGLMVFEPAFVQAAVGDTIHFVPTDPGHNAQTIGGMLPHGVPMSAGEFGKPFDLKLTKAGLYGIECMPHFGLGMVALIKAGTGASPNAASARAAKLPPLAKKRMMPMLAQAR